LVIDLPLAPLSTRFGIARNNAQVPEKTTFAASRVRISGKAEASKICAILGNCWHQRSGEGAGRVDFVAPAVPFFAAAMSGRHESRAVGDRSEKVEGADPAFEELMISSSSRRLYPVGAQRRRCVNFALIS